MSIFTKPSERPATRLDAPVNEGAMSVIAHGMRILGDIESTGVIKVEGVIEGSVRGARQLFLGRSGVVHGDVHVGDAIVGGKIVGSVVALDRVELQSTASIEGDIHTKSIVVYEGGSLNGAVRMGEVVARPARPLVVSAAPSVRLAIDS
jgi:cytoskeletal protein CcmA (bactofilin family)